MTEPELLTHRQFEDRRRMVWAWDARRVNLLFGITVAVFGIGFLIEYVLTAVPGWVRAAVPALVLVPTLGGTLVSGWQFDRMLQELDLLCPSCGARLVGRFNLDGAVASTGVCQRCSASVLGPDGWPPSALRTILPGQRVPGGQRSPLD